MLKRIGLALFLSVIAYQVRAEGPLQSQRYFQNNGGLIDHISPLLIPVNKASALLNITMDDRGQLSKRNGYTILNTTDTLSNLTSAILGGADHTFADGHTDFVVVAGTDIWRTTNSFGGSWTKITGSVSLTTSNSNVAQATNLQDKIIFCNESDKPFTVPTSGNAVVISTNTFSAAKTCGTYGSYLVVANTTESAINNQSRVRWSDINNTESFPANNYIDIEPQDGDKIIAVVGFEDNFYIFKQRTIYKMMITGLDGADAFIIRPAARNIGAWAKNSIQVVPGVGIFFLSQNTVYLLSGNAYTSSTELSGLSYGVDLVPVGDPIQRTLDSLNRGTWASSVSSVYPRRYQYWLSVSTDGVHESETLVYDYVQKAWTIYNGITATMLAQARDNTGQSVLISGDDKGNVYKQDNGTSDNPSNVASAITGSYTTGDLTLDSPEYTKNFKYLYLITQIDVTTTLTVNAAFDYNVSYEYSKALSLGTSAGVYDTAVYDTDIYPALGLKTTRIEINRSAKSIKLNFTNSTSGSIVGVVGWVIVYQNEDYKQ